MKTIFVFGGDGYIGNSLIQRLLNKRHKVIAFDNFWRRKWIEEMKSISATPIFDMGIKTIKFKNIGDFEFFNLDIEKEPNRVDYFIKEYKPDCIVNLAHNPSAPYSMISRNHANKVLTNNIIGTNNVLWGIKKHCPDCHYLTIGTAGEYCHNSNIDISEGYFSFEYNGRQSTELMYPRQGNSIYHCSKISSSYIIDYLARVWDIKITDIQQGVVFGNFTDDVKYSRVFSRFDFDESGGTCLNRFIVQAILGIPLTIFGRGLHKRSFLSLNDSIQALELLINSGDDVKPGEVRSVNQLSEWWSINDMANMVIEVGNEFGLNVTPQHIESPRKEYTGDHYYNFITEKLEKLGYKPTRTIKEEIKYCIGLLLPYKDKLIKYKDVVIPKINFIK